MDHINLLEMCTVLIACRRLLNPAPAPQKKQWVKLHSITISIIITIEIVFELHSTDAAKRNFYAQNRFKAPFVTT